MTSENSQNRNAWEVAFGQAPVKGSRAMQQLLDFKLQNPIAISLAFEQAQKKLEFVQGMYIDNRSNPNTLTATFGATGQIIDIPAGAQALLPVLADASLCEVSFSTTDLKDFAPTVPVFFLSFPVPIAIWPDNGGGTGTDYSTNQPSLLDTLIATVPVNPQRKHIMIKASLNGTTSTNTFQIVLDDGTGGNITIITCGGYDSLDDFWESWTFTGRIRIYCALVHAATINAAIHEE